MKLHDTSNELILQSFGNGVKLVAPQTKSTSAKGYTINELMQFPFNIAFSNTEVSIQRINEQTAATMGFDSPYKAEGTNVFSVLQKESAEKLLQQNIKVVKTKKTVIEEEEIMRKDEVSLKRLSIYTPWYDHNDTIIGIFGCTVVIGKQPLANALVYMKELGLLNQSVFSFFPETLNRDSVDDFHFSKREKDCIYYIVRGRTIKETASFLGLSKRTVEYYFEQIKMKLNVNSKSEAIARILDGYGKQNLYKKTK